jgi:hypothetical protein
MVGLLMGAGSAALVAGFLALVMSVPIRDFEFGKTLMIVGTIGAASGLIVVALAAILREIRKMSTPPLVLPATTARPEFPPRPASPVSQPTTASEVPFPLPPRTTTERSALPPHPEAGAPPAAPEAARPPVATKRNLLFRRSPDSERAAPPPAETEREAPSSDEQWPGRPPEGLWKRRRRETVPPEPMLDLNESSAAAAGPQVTVLKSGEVDGMAYTLYSDGSIEAQLAEGMVRFASIEALRAHLDQRPG